MTTADTNNSEIERLDRASAPAIHRLRDLKVLGSDHAEDVLDYVVSRPHHRKGIGCKTSREFLKLDGGRFCLHYVGDSTEKWVRWEAGETFLVKTRWTDAWPESKSDGQIEYELRDRDSVGHHLDHVVTAFSNPTVLLRENHFDEWTPKDPAWEIASERMEQEDA